jgi:hypothetical protein
MAEMEGVLSPIETVAVRGEVGLSEVVMNFEES